MARMTGAEAIVATLRQHGVDMVFGLPGVQLDNLFDALHGARQSVRTLHARHEQGAAYMALGYAQASGKVGVFTVVPGPGVLNATAALCAAAGSNVPVLCLAGQIPSRQIGLGLGIPHEILDQPRALSGVVSWVGRAEAPGEVPARLDEAFDAMLGARHQPAMFEMAPDVMGATAEVALAEPVAPAPVMPDAGAIARAARLLAGARCPAIFVGSGVFDAEAELRAVAERSARRSVKWPVWPGCRLGTSRGGGGGSCLLASWTPGRTAGPAAPARSGQGAMVPANSASTRWCACSANAGSWHQRVGKVQPCWAR